jgi:hypothetical protein
MLLKGDKVCGVDSAKAFCTFTEILAIANIKMSKIAIAF